MALQQAACCSLRDECPMLAGKMAWGGHGHLCSQPQPPSQQLPKGARWDEGRKGSAQLPAGSLCCQPQPSHQGTPTLQDAPKRLLSSLTPNLSWGRGKGNPSPNCNLPALSSWHRLRAAGMAQESPKPPSHPPLLLSTGAVGATHLDIETATFHFPSFTQKEFMRSASLRSLSGEVGGGWHGETEAWKSHTLSS